MGVAEEAMALMILVCFALTLLSWSLWRQVRKWKAEYAELGRAHAVALDKVAYLTDILEDFGVDVATGYGIDAVLHVLQTQEAARVVQEEWDRQQGAGAAQQSLPRVPSRVRQCPPGPQANGRSGPPTTRGDRAPVDPAAGGMPPVRPPYPREVPRGSPGGSDQRRGAYGGKPPADPSPLQSG